MEADGACRGCGAIMILCVESRVYMLYIDILINMMLCLEVLYVCGCQCNYIKLKPYNKMVL